MLSKSCASEYVLCILAGGSSSGCPQNSGAAGTFYDAVSRSLIVSNHNMSTDTDTLLMEFPNQPLMTNVFIRNHAKAAVPLLWSRVQVGGFPVFILLNVDLKAVVAVKCKGTLLAILSKLYR